MIRDGDKIPGSQIRVHRRGEKCISCNRPISDIYFVSPGLDGEPSYWLLQTKRRTIMPLRRTGCTNTDCEHGITLTARQFEEEGTNYIQSARALKLAIRGQAFAPKQHRKQRRGRRHE